MLEFADVPTTLEPRWHTWAELRSPQPAWLARVDCDDRGERIVGCFVTNAATALGLRPWDDADDGDADGAAWALFDVEKLVRMALHQSGLAFEALTSARTWGAGFPAREIARAAVTRDVLGYYRDITAPLEAGRADVWRYRSLLTGVLLAEQGVVSHDLQTLAAELAVDTQPDSLVIPALRARLSAEALPKQPSDYDFLNDFVVQARLGAP